jgi:hypothetical protein
VARLLSILSAIFIGVSFLVGLMLVITDRQWAVAFYVLISGALTGIIFAALATILHRLEENRLYLERIMSVLPQPSHPKPPFTPTFKAKEKPSLASLKDYKMNTMD